MKKMFFAFLAVTVLSLASCSKERRINNQLDGSWKATIVDDVAVPSGMSLTYKFEKGKKGKGTGTQTTSGTGQFDGTVNFNYEISGDKIAMTYTNTAFSNVYTVTEHSKKKMVLTDVADGKKTTLEAQ